MNKITVKQLIKILENYDEDRLVIIDHIEGYICPNLIQEIKVKPVKNSDEWKEFKGDFQIAEDSFDDCQMAVHLSIKE
jgi:hypothetical protein